MSNTKLGTYTNYSYASQARATAWRVDEAKTGVFVRTLDDHILCRVAQGSIFFYDRQKKSEIEVSLSHLMNLAGSG